MPINRNYSFIAKVYLLLVLALCSTPGFGQALRSVKDFDNGWMFHLGDVPGAEKLTFKPVGWRTLNLPHDWSIEGQFSKDNPATPEGGALPGGIGWYRKVFTVQLSSKGKLTYIDFDGVYQKSEVWINGHRLGFRPNGYISFRYELTDYLNYGTKPNVITVKVDNSTQPNSRWYSGSGIYRNVWLVTTGQVAVDQWGTYVTTTDVSEESAVISIKTTINNNILNPDKKFTLSTAIYGPDGKPIAGNISPEYYLKDGMVNTSQGIRILKPKLWSVDSPYLYKVLTKVIMDNKPVDEYWTTVGIRYFDFDKNKGFSLNGKAMKILGVCNHHDLGSLGAAINIRAMERQLQMLKEMGCNAIRTSHNPPAPELLDLCDKMGFIVMDEAFDCWEKPKAKFDYHLYFKEWAKRDLTDQLLRDRNHPSVFIWSIGNEIPEQGDSTGTRIAKELAAVVKEYDNRPITTANDKPWNGNFIVKSGELDLVGYNYHHNDYESFHKTFPGMKFIGTETTSALQTRGHYDMPSDSIRRWPNNKEMKNGVGIMNADYTVSAYDNVSAPWGSTHEETWKLIKKHNYLSGMFVWTGFDYLGEPTPYTWPARSSYFGIIDLAGFPKDVYYMYQSEWTNKPVLHIFPHWNWEAGKTVDVWAYYNNADEVELFLNGKSQGVKRRRGEDLHVMWRLKFEPGTLKAVSRKNGEVVLTKEIHTAGAPAKIELVADRNNLTATGKDLAFITARILDADGNVVPNADNRVTFKLTGNAFIAAVDNGDPVSHDPFKADNVKAFHGLALGIIQARDTPGTIAVTAVSPGLSTAVIYLKIK
ncbi:beta-galactosidase GalB [Mucilaginibacter gynuensis]|uniref:Beta-galactosidase GalB n=1 Tax=Mucilaginibacter gynuensis TaxID=1302236 RepID=A0ABP8GUD3_9SPHI